MIGWYGLEILLIRFFLGGKIFNFKDYVESYKPFERVNITQQVCFTHCCTFISFLFTSNLQK